MPVWRDELMCVRAGRSVWEMAFRRCEGMGSRGQVVGWLQRSLHNPSSVSGVMEEIRLLAVGEVSLGSCVWSWELTADISSFVCGKSWQNHQQLAWRWWWTEERVVSYCVCLFYVALGSVCTGCKKSGVLLQPHRSFCTLPLLFSRASDESFRFDF